MGAKWTENILKSFGFKKFNKWCQLDLKTAAKRSKNYKVALLEFKEYFDKNHKRRRNFWFFKKIRKRRDTCSHHICTRREEQALFIIGRSYRNHEKISIFHQKSGSHNRSFLEKSGPIINGSGAVPLCTYGSHSFSCPLHSSVQEKFLRIAYFW